jgi:DNA-binding XRE family transcriptional regulator
MLAVVKTPRTKKTMLEIRGQIPNWMLLRLRKEYKGNLIVEDEKSESKESDLINIFETPWFASIESKMSPGENLRIYRENAGLSQTDMGIKLGNIPRQNISAMENGKRGVSKEIAKKLAEIFKAPLDRFI